MRARCHQTVFSMNSTLLLEMANQSPAWFPPKPGRPAVPHVLFDDNERKEVAEICFSGFSVGVPIAVPREAQSLEPALLFPVHELATLLLPAEPQVADEPKANMLLGCLSDLLSADDTPSESDPRSIASNLDVWPRTDGELMTESMLLGSKPRPIKSSCLENG
jgi:hypothetical protein